MNTSDIQNMALLEPSHKAKIIRTLVVSLYIFISLMYFVKVTFIGFEDYGESFDKFYKIYYLAWGAFWLLPFCFMSRIALNKAVGVSVIFIAIAEALLALVYASNLIESGFVAKGTTIVEKLFVIYLFSCMIVNGVVTSNTKTWLNIAVLIECTGVINLIMGQILFNLYDSIDFGGNGALMNQFHYSEYRFAIGYRIYTYFITFFDLIVFYKICCNELFSGNYVRLPKEKYNPFNKYTVGAVIAIAVTCGLIYWVFSNREEILSLI